MILFLKPVSDNVLMLLATSTKFTPKERDVVIPKIMSGKKMRNIYHSYLDDDQFAKANL